MRNCYSPLKIFHHQDKLDVLRKGFHPSPIHVQIVPTNRCNQNCEFCAYRTSGYSSNEQFEDQDEIPIDKLLQIVESCKQLGVRAVELTGGGEPTVHKYFPELCKALRDNGIQYGVVTNGVKCDDAILDALHHATWVRFSIDSANPTTYASMRGSTEPTFHRVKTHIAKLYASRIGTNPVIGIGFVVTEHNYNQILDAATMAMGLGIDNFRISALFQDDGSRYFESFYDEAVRQCAAARGLNSTNGFTVFDLFSDRLQDLSQGSPNYHTCLIQRLCTYIGADLNVYRCCVLAYNRRGLLGSLQDQSFYRLWVDSRAQFENFDARQCPRCMFNNKNRTIAYAVDPNPEHVNFI